MNEEKAREREGRRVILRVAIKGLYGKISRYDKRSMNSAPIGRSMTG
jgi:hypothetical protein